MKKLKATALVILAAAITAASLSGCGIIRRVLDSQPETVVQTVYVTQEPTTAQPTTAQPTTVEATTAAPTTAEPATAAPTPKYSTESNGSAVLVDNEKYHDSYLGITFTVPKWVGKVYAKGGTNNGLYSLAFYEKTNYNYGEDHGMSEFGMLFTVTATSEESSGDHIDYPAGSVTVDGTKYYLTYFKPTDVRFDPSLADNYQSVYKLQRDYFLSGVVDKDKHYVPSAVKNALNLKSE